MAYPPLALWERPLATAMDKQAIWQHQAHWRDLLLFYAYVHGDTGAGFSASLQTGWRGFVAKRIQQSGV